MIRLRVVQSCTQHRTWLLLCLSWRICNIVNLWSIPPRPMTTSVTYLILLFLFASPSRAIIPNRCKSKQLIIPSPPWTKSNESPGPHAEYYWLKAELTPDATCVVLMRLALDTSTCPPCARHLLADYDIPQP
jgi:hypothetical protein